MEIWKTIDDYPNYEISSIGRVKNKKTNKILKPYIHRDDGYDSVTLRNHTGQHTKKIHRLVAETFYECSRDDLEVNHIDGNKKNNFVGNLEWCTRSENMSHAFSNNLIKISEKAGIPRKKVQIIETGEIFNSLHDCAKQINGRVSNIIGCLIGRQKTHRGYHFKEP